MTNERFNSYILVNILHKSITGDTLSEEEVAYCRAAWAQDPKQYAKLHAIAKDEAIAGVNPLYKPKGNNNDA